jgi:predicted glycosyltransferase involved in capsule biosynthesis
MKVNIEDLTFIIPIRLDSVIRIENLLATVNHIYNNCITNIFILESAPFYNGIIKCLLGDRVKYQFVKDLDPIFHRTKYRNILTEQVETPYLAVWDADVIISIEQIIESIKALRSNNYDISFPYNGEFLDTTFFIRALYFEKCCDFDILYRNQKRMYLLYGNKHKGGAFLANTKKYREAGSENESFYGWGPEDYERFERWKVYKYNIYNASGVSFHLSHSRDINGKFNSSFQKDFSRSELRKTKLSTLEEFSSNCK